MNRKEKVIGALRTEHPVKAFLQAAVIVLQSQIEDSPLVSRIVP
jgi:hypothetical protein